MSLKNVILTPEVLATHLHVRVFAGLDSAVGRSDLRLSRGRQVEICKMAVVTRSAHHMRVASERKARAFGRACRRVVGGARSSPRLAALRWRRMANYIWESPRDYARFNRLLVGYIRKLIMDGSIERFYCRVVRLMGHYPGMVDASFNLRRLLAGVRERNRIDGHSQVHVERVYRQMGRTSYYGF